MLGRRELRRRKLGHLVAAGVALSTAAGLAAGEIPDSVRERALQELRVLDDVPGRAQRSSRSAATKPAGKTPPANNAAPVAKPDDRWKLPSRPSDMAEPFPPAPAAVSAPASQPVTPAPSDQNPFHEVEETPPTAQSASNLDPNAQNDRGGEPTIGSKTAHQGTQQPATSDSVSPVKSSLEPAIVVVPRSLSAPLGVERPVSVLDVLAQSIPEPDSREETAEQAPVITPRPVAKAPEPKAPLFANRNVPATPAFERPLSKAATPALTPKTPTADQKIATSPTVPAKVPQEPQRLAVPETRELESDPPAAPASLANDMSSSDESRLEARADREGLLGFCPVSLRERRTLVDGRPEFTSVHLGETFAFATAEAQAAFDSDPDRYAPANDGRDLVLASGKIHVRGSLRHATYFQDRLYLFRSEQTYRLFVRDPGRYVVTDAASMPAP